MSKYHLEVGTEPPLPAPRTEAAIQPAHTFDRDAEVVPAEFARELERELASLLDSIGSFGQQMARLYPKP